jgi:hypothetical protein
MTLEESAHLEGITVGEAVLSKDDYAPKVVFGANPLKPNELIILFQDDTGATLAWSVAPIEHVLFHTVNLMQNMSQLFQDCRNSVIQ